MLCVILLVLFQLLSSTRAGTHSEPGTNNMAKTHTPQSIHISEKFCQAVHYNSSITTPCHFPFNHSGKLFNGTCLKSKENYGWCQELGRRGNLKSWKRCTTCFATCEFMLVAIIVKGYNFNFRRCMQLTITCF